MTSMFCRENEIELNIRISAYMRYSDSAVDIECLIYTRLQTLTADAPMHQCRRIVELRTACLLLFSLSRRRV